MSPNDNSGLLPRAVKDIFNVIDKEKETIETKVSVSYLQIYMEQIQDLLQPENNNLQIREGKHKIYVEGLTKHQVRNADDILLLMDIGNRSRTVAQTKLNEQSSRSHTLFFIFLERKNKKTGNIISSAFTVCDLAGSERAHKSQAVGKQFDEAKFINLSLSSLGNCVAALANDSTGFIPWRDSKLTRILQEHMSGNSRISLIININPEDSFVQESVTSLLFGKRAMVVAVKPKINEEINYKNLALELEAKLDALQHANTKEISELLVKNENVTMENQQLNEQLDKTKKQLKQILAEKEQMTSDFTHSMTNNEKYSAELMKYQERVANLETIISLMSQGEKKTNADGIVSDDGTNAGNDVSGASGDQFLNANSKLLFRMKNFLFEERETLKQTYIATKKENETMKSKMDLLENALGNEIQHLTQENEKKQRLISDLLRAQTELQQYKDESAVEIKRVSEMLVLLENKYIVDSKNSNFNIVNIQPASNSTETTESSAQPVENQPATEIPQIQIPFHVQMKNILIQLLNQLEFREKTIEVLVQQLRVLEVETKRVVSNTIFNAEKNKNESKDKDSHDRLFCMEKPPQLNESSLLDFIYFPFQREVPSVFKRYHEISDCIKEIEKQFSNIKSEIKYTGITQANILDALYSSPNFVKFQNANGTPSKPTNMMTMELQTPNSNFKNATKTPNSTSKQQKPIKELDDFTMALNNISRIYKVLEAEKQQREIDEQGLHELSQSFASSPMANSFNKTSVSGSLNSTQFNNTSTANNTSTITAAATNLQRNPNQFL